ncbi:hypothetical protein AJ79_09741 [Helicocarpus griseus UAMH5409]|uniref:Uncharacterized protein n=1 Tax=Helicocarpus griseus UAMH5409 TaxID=1447875 RepID=A0A2B7WHM4_9EURO|nr:hypothetical protein AJ79_09741 [Helicocarpus griseus UAMH5409]
MANPTTYAIPRKLWEHPDPESSQLGQFRRRLERRTGLRFPTFHSLYDYSITHRAAFWDFCFRDLNPIHSGTYTTVVDETARMDSIPRWFSGTHLNFAENMLFSPSSSPSSIACTTGKEDAKIALTEVREGGAEGARNVSWGELRRMVGRLAQAMKSAGVRRGDRAAVVASNSVETLVVFLAVTALGGIFSSSSTDMGVKGILDRLVQIRPRWLFMDDWTVYNGKTIDLRGKMEEVVKGMEAEGVQEFQGVVAQPRFRGRPADVSGVARTQTLAEFLEKASSDKLEFERVGFSDPFLIVYSSGTTGIPKCIVHSVGGVVLTGMKEGKLHREIGSNSVAMQYTTTGWIMYLGGVQPLLHGCRVVLYDGSPFLPDTSFFMRLAGEQK